MRIVVSVSNDISTDQRLHRICSSLANSNYEVLLLGRKLKNSPQLPKFSFKTKRFKLLFNKGPAFYACLNIRLFGFLLFAKSDIFLSNDLDTLPANYLAAKLRRKKLVYDSHELFTEVPELHNRPRVKRIWEKIEKLFLPKLKNSYTVCQSIANYYSKKYSIKMQVIRNVPTQKTISTNFENRDKTLIYQGVLNKGRGLEWLIEAMSFLKDYNLKIAGTGDIESELIELTQKLKLQNVEFLGRILPKNLHKITETAILGFSLEEDLGLNYRYALPNKIFDYVQAGVPVFTSNLIEMSKLVNQYNIGKSQNFNSPEELSKIILETLSQTNELHQYHENCVKAAAELNWEKEGSILRGVFENLK
ncbi:MAG: glycosyltransferase family 4 protein [Bacteroidales bacterium]|nr:glycosyltransferase family 4 protein [Bacteroidales bacterium]